MLERILGNRFLIRLVVRVLSPGDSGWARGSRLARDRRLWICMSHEPGQIGYASYSPKWKDTVLTYCNKAGWPVWHIIYEPVGKGRQLLLSIATRVGLVRSSEKVILDVGCDDLHASLYDSPTGGRYLRIPSKGWFVGGFERRAPWSTAKPA